MKRRENELIEENARPSSTPRSGGHVKKRGATIWRSIYDIRLHGHRKDQKSGKTLTTQIRVLASYGGRETFHGAGTLKKVF